MAGLCRSFTRNGIQCPTEEVQLGEAQVAHEAVYSPTINVFVKTFAAIGVITSIVWSVRMCGIGKDEYTTIHQEV